ncbi:hypothetical protein [Teredinibacter franksiae]|jgi:hypothetical protein|nr:hypothetical protein [Teredinibacter franksiae]
MQVDRLVALGDSGVTYQVVAGEAQASDPLLNLTPTFMEVPD